MKSFSRKARPVVLWYSAYFVLPIAYLVLLVSLERGNMQY
jgi:hypothetical protein